MYMHSCIDWEGTHGDEAFFQLMPSLILWRLGLGGARGVGGGDPTIAAVGGKLTSLILSPPASTAFDRDELGKGLSMRHRWCPPGHKIKYQTIQGCKCMVSV